MQILQFPLRRPDPLALEAVMQAAEARIQARFGVPDDGPRPLRIPRYKTMARSMLRAALGDRGFEGKWAARSRYRMQALQWPESCSLQEAIGFVDQAFASEKRVVENAERYGRFLKGTDLAQLYELRIILRLMRRWPNGDFTFRWFAHLYTTALREFTREVGTDD